MDDEPPLIEHDEGEFRRPILAAIWAIRIQIFVLVGIGFAILQYYRSPNSFDIWNVPFVILWLCLLAWLIPPRVPLVDASGHEGARDGFAFRIGKSLKRVLNNRRGNTTPGD